VIPEHPKDLAVATFHAIVAQLGIELKDFEG
jgi:hypothetical protein